MIAASNSPRAATIGRVGAPVTIDLELDDEGRITRLEPAMDDGRPRIRVLEFAPPTATTQWLVTIAADPALSAKTTHVPLMHDPLLKPVKRPK